MKKRILMIAYHYPPLHGSSGIQRTLRFSKFLPKYGWEPIVLTAHPRAYQDTSNDQLADIADQAIVHRAFALDTSKHFSLMKRYPRILALPDRWITWALGAIPTGLYLIKKYKPDVIWSTYPIATAHLIALALNRMTGVPWLADFRDPMIQPDYPSNPQVYRAYQWIENKTIINCTRAVFTTPGTLHDYQLRFPEFPSSRLSLIENGYDEESFSKAELAITGSKPINKQFTLVHSGIIYPSERNPIPFFEALSSLFKRKLLTAEIFKVILRATRNDEYLRGLIEQYGIDPIVSLEPPIPYQQALSEMLAADGLLILQASNCNNQIPAKLYEYLRAHRPILALTDPTGDTAKKLTSVGINTIARLDSKHDIMHKLMEFIESIKNNNIQIISADKVKKNSREYRTEELVQLLNNIKN